MAIRTYDAAIDGVGCATELIIGESAEDVTLNCSSSDGAFFELDGAEDWRGQYSVLGGSSAQGYPNDTFTLTFNVAQDVDKGGTGPAIISAVRVDMDFVRNWPVMHTVQFAGTGASAFAYGAQTTSDASTPTPLPSKDGKIDIATPAGSPSFSTLSHVLGASLVVFSDVFPWHDSSSQYGKQRVAGVLGWRFDIVVHADDVTALEALNGNRHVRMYVDSTNYWDVKWVKWKKVGDLRVKIMGREYLTSRYRGMGTGYVPISSTWTKGGLIDPSSTTIWGS